MENSFKKQTNKDKTVTKTETLQALYFITTPINSQSVLLTVAQPAEPCTGIAPHVCHAIWHPFCHMAVRLHHSEAKYNEVQQGRAFCHFLVFMSTVMASVINEFVSALMRQPRSFTAAKTAPFGP